MFKRAQIRVLRSSLCSEADLNSFSRRPQHLPSHRAVFFLAADGRGMRRASLPEKLKRLEKINLPPEVSECAEQRQKKRGRGGDGTGELNRCPGDRRTCTEALYRQLP